MKEVLVSGLGGFKTILKKRKSNDRCYLLLAVFAFVGTMFTQYNFQVMYMYLRLPPLKFKMEDFSRWMGIAGVFVMCGNYVIIPLMTKKLKFNDATISLIGKETLLTNRMKLNFYSNIFEISYVSAHIIIMSSFYFSFI